MTRTPPRPICDSRRSSTWASPKAVRSPPHCAPTRATWLTVLLPLLLTAACSGTATGILYIDGTPFVPTTCRSGETYRFVGVELTDENGKRVQLNLESERRPRFGHRPAQHRELEHQGSRSPLLIIPAGMTLACAARSRSKRRRAESFIGTSPARPRSVAIRGLGLKATSSSRTVTDQASWKRRKDCTSDRPAESRPRGTSPRCRTRRPRRRSRWPRRS